MLELSTHFLTHLNLNMVAPSDNHNICAHPDPEQSHLACNSTFVNKEYPGLCVRCTVLLNPKDAQDRATKEVSNYFNNHILIILNS